MTYTPETAARLQKAAESIAQNVAIPTDCLSAALSEITRLTRERDEAREEAGKWRVASSALCGEHIGVKVDACPSCELRRAADRDRLALTAAALTGYLANAKVTRAESLLVKDAVSVADATLAAMRSTNGTRERVVGGDAEGAGETAQDTTPAPPIPPLQSWTRPSPMSPEQLFRVYGTAAVPSDAPPPSPAASGALKACPFCGWSFWSGEVEYLCAVDFDNTEGQQPDGKVRFGSKWVRRVCCKKCGAASANYATTEEAIAAWNSRRAAPEADAEVAELVEALRDLPTIDRNDWLDAQPWQVPQTRRLRSALKALYRRETGGRGK